MDNVDTTTGTKRILTPKQAQFVKEYLHDRDAEQAATRAGYSAQTAAVWGKKLLSQPHIQAAIASAIETDTTAVTKELVVKELAAIAFTTMADVCKWNKEGVNLIDSSCLSRKHTAAVAEISETSTGKGSVKIKMHAKLKALEMLGRHLGMFGTGTDKETSDEYPPTTLPSDITEQLELLYRPTEE